MENKILILGAGITGLSTAISTHSEIYEANNIPGGICASYYITLGKNRKTYSRINEDSYRFEIGGGHWIFGADNNILNFINSLSPTKAYERKAAVFLPDLNLYIPYPIQNHLFYLPKEIRDKALREIIAFKDKSTSTLADWLEINFGKTLCELFFFPFHKLYTAGLYTKIAPQDKFKTPCYRKLIIQGAKGETPAVGYNIIFAYPKNGLDDLITKMTDRCKIHYDKKVEEINLKKREVAFKDGTIVRYEKIISILPLNKMIKMAKIEIDEKPLPFTSVLVINIGAKKGERCPDYHWIYILKSKTGFHRVGFYSNVDNSFLPLKSRKDNNKVSIYVEKVYKGGEKPKDEEIKELSNSIIKELQEWKFITELEVVDHNWIEVAYTWEYPNSKCREEAIKILSKNDIYQAGRYGKWKFQGISESIEDGLSVKESSGGSI